MNYFLTFLDVMNRDDTPKSSIYKNDDGKYMNKIILLLFADTKHTKPLITLLSETTLSLDTLITLIYKLKSFGVVNMNEDLIGLTDKGIEIAEWLKMSCKQN